MSADAKAWLQLGLAVVGFGAVVGSLLGGVYGYARVLAGVLYEDEEPA